jgi:AraC family transcriptional regulator of adaptative response/methylated-DNA-[protein]-cysteine methyltransferase
MQSDQLVYRIVNTPIGPFVVGATAKGCCVCEFEDRGGLEKIKTRLEKRYGLKPVSGSCELVDRLAGELGEYFAGDRTTFTGPLDLRGTRFEKSVWAELLNIPFGETSSYGRMAEKLGKPGGARAVGRANGANSLAIVIPCHRVIQENGELRGYGGGLWRKRWLLDHERAVAGGVQSFGTKGLSIPVDSATARSQQT